MPWTVAAVAIAAAVIVAVTSGSTTKKQVTKPPPAVQITPLAVGNLPPIDGVRTMDNGVTLTLATTGTLAVQVNRLILQPGASEPWHEHYGSGLAIVVKGTVNDYEQVGTGATAGCHLYVLTAGQDRFDVGNHPHSLLNAGNTPAEVIVTGWAPVGKTAPLIPEHPPAKCSEKQ